MGERQHLRLKRKIFKSTWAIVLLVCRFIRVVPETRKGQFFLVSQGTMSLFPAYISLTSTSNDDTQTTKSPSPTPSNQTGTYEQMKKIIHKQTQIQQQDKTNSEQRIHPN